MFLDHSCKCSLSASGWWTTLGWVVVALKGKSTDITPKTPKTDWLTFLWVLILTPTDHFAEILFAQRFQRWHRHCRVVDWDGTGTTADLWDLMLGLKQRGARFGSGSCSKQTGHMMLRGNHRVNGVAMSWTKDGDNQQCCSLDSEF